MAKHSEGGFMSGLEEIARAIEFAQNNTSGVERKIYDNMIQYLQTNDEYYQQQMEKYYNEADYEAKNRAKELQNMMAEYYYRNR